MQIYFKQTAIGMIGICENSGFIANLYFQNDCLPTAAELAETPLIKEAFSQLLAYFSGKLRTFSIPIMPNGPEFSKKVWSAISEIPYGKTQTYKNIAIKIEKPTSSRAIGLCSGKTPIPILIPCHRVIGSNGNLTGYRGGIKVKEMLLALERNAITS